MKELISEIQKDFQILKFINKYNWKGINYPSKIDDWEMLKKNNPTIVLIMYIKEKGICPAYISKNISNCKKTI